MKPTKSVERALLDDLNVSRETFARLSEYAGLLEKWNPKINLVSPKTLPELWTRHILDSAQVASHFGEEVNQFCDIGSGGGLPGMVLAILLSERSPKAQITLLESDRRKCAFLQTVSGHLGLRIAVRPERIEAAFPVAADVLSARALAPLPKLIGYAARHLTPKGHAFLMKGANVDVEIDEALASWSFDLQKHPSRTQADASILEVSNIRPRQT